MSRAKKSLGQNFLVDLSVVDRIIDASNLSKSEEVIEIGPGTGVLTKEIIKVCKKLTAYELDDRLAETLKTSFKQKKIKIINQDFLKSELKWSNKKILIANIPYYITSHILFKLFYNSDLFKRAIIMVQKEVGDRLTATAGSSECGKLTITTQYFADVEKIIDVPRNCFIPIPKVDSVVILLKFKRKKFNLETQIRFLEFVKQCFFMRRKTLVNNLKKMNIILEKNEFKKLDIMINMRPQELSLKNYINLFKYLYIK